jgi:hypothetical protein
MAFEACVFLPASQQGLAELCGKQDLGGRFRGSASHGIRPMAAATTTATTAAPATTES